MSTARVVLDTNVLISAFISPNKDSAPRQLYDACVRGRFFLLLSDDILEEVFDVLNRPRIKRMYKLTDKEISQFILELKKNTIVATHTNISVVVEDPDDNKFIACAIDGKGDYIVSGDKHLLDLEAYNGVRILTVREFLMTLVEEQGKKS